MADQDSVGRNQTGDDAGERSETQPVTRVSGQWHFCHLPFSYQLLIWAARMWNNEDVEPVRRWSTIRQAFAKVNAEDATVAFLRLMEVIQAGAAQAILIGEGGCAVFADEIRLAESIAVTARGNAACGEARLRCMLVPGAARMAQALVSDLAAELVRAGLRFPRIGMLASPDSCAGERTLH